MFEHRERGIDHECDVDGRVATAVVGIILALHGDGDGRGLATFDGVGKICLRGVAVVQVIKRAVSVEIDAAIGVDRRKTAVRADDDLSDISCIAIDRQNLARISGRIGLIVVQNAAIACVERFQIARCLALEHGERVIHGEVVRFAGDCDGNTRRVGEPVCVSDRVIECKLGRGILGHLDELRSRLDGHGAVGVDRDHGRIAFGAEHNERRADRGAACISHRDRRAIKIHVIGQNVEHAGLVFGNCQHIIEREWWRDAVRFHQFVVFHPIAADIATAVDGQLSPFWGDVVVEGEVVACFAFQLHLDHHIPVAAFIAHPEVTFGVNLTA